MESRTFKVRRSIVWGILSRCAHILTPFVTRTIMIYRMGIEYVGLNSLFTSILSILSFAELGVGSAMVFSMYRPIAEEDTEKVNALLALYRRWYRIIGTIILALGLCLTPLLPRLVSSELPAGISLYRLFGIYLANAVIGYYLFSYRVSLFTADQRVDIINAIEMGTNLLAGLIQSVILLTTRDYYLYAITVPVVTCANLFIGYVLSRKCYPQYHCEGKLSKDELHTILKKVGGLFFYKLGSIVLNAVDAIVISAFLGLKILGIYNGYYYVITALFSFITVIQTAIVPSIGNSALASDEDSFYWNFRKFNFLYVWIASWCSACLLCLYQPFIRLWQGEQNMLSDGMVVLFVLYFYTFKMGDMCALHREALGIWWEGKFVPLISSVVNLMLNIALVQIIGLPGIVISTIVALTLIFVPSGGWVLFRRYFRSRQKFRSYLYHLAFYLMVMCVVSAGTWCACQIVPVGGIRELILKGMVCLVMPNLLLLLLNVKNRDFQLAADFVKNSVLRRN